MESMLRFKGLAFTPLIQTDPTQSAGAGQCFCFAMREIRIRTHRTDDKTLVRQKSRRDLALRTLEHGI